MTKQIAKPYFRDWSNLRFHKGKVFVAPERLFKAETALWFPNFFGRTLRKGAERRDKKDGYRGMGRDTCDVMRGKVSLVNFVTNNWAANQTATWRSGNLAEALRGNLDIAQVVEINYENNLLKYWIWRLFALPRLRRSMPQPGLQERYFLVRRGFNEEMKEAMGVLNEKAGYLYLVDRDCRIRWAGSAVAEEHEKESLVRGLKKLLLEARGARTTKKQRLESAVNDVVDDGKEKVAAAG
jgi:ATPase complex subunit ATP10